MLILMLLVNILLVSSSVFLKFHFIAYPLPEGLSKAQIELVLIQAITSVNFWLALLSTIAGSAIWAYVVSRAELSVVFPMIGLSYGLMVIPAHFLFGESITMAKIAGICAMMIGVWLLNQ